MPTHVVCRCISHKCKSERYIDNNLQRSGRIVNIGTYERHAAEDERLVREFAALEHQNGPYSLSQMLTGILPSHRESTPTPSDDGTATLTGMAPSRPPKFNHPLIVEDDPTIKELREAIEIVINLLATWLHLVWGLSREATSRALKVIQVIVLFAIRLGHQTAQVQFMTTNNRNWQPNIAKDMPPIYLTLVYIALQQEARFAMRISKKSSNEETQL
ncbi:hypothetical protein CVT24_013202 [Panaeolus cyanescens]|uniref:Uncharacterized protein n=1 Tax=Panaeolus cyanescens TaxID=181874 RepID=A0A409YMP1_9AGAR|nr:hypothetical protein CVT24_013202 [Panaeolus cyanescens]